MRLISSISVALLLASGSVGAQPAATTWRSTAKTAAFVEIFGNGGLFTYNVDRKLNQRTTARLAYGRYSSIEFGDQETKHYRTFTAMLNVLRGGPHWWWEIGVGGRVGSYRGDYWVIPSEPVRDVTAVLGVRRQPLGGGLVVRAGIIPRYVIRGEWTRHRLQLGPAVSAGVAF